jgi:quercetin dioxygenase-like cupin family protein
MTIASTGILNDVTAVQANALVSTTLLKKSTGSVTIFAFDTNQSISEHQTPFSALVIVLEGELQITISGKLHTVKAGNYLIMPANDPHALTATEPSKMMLVMIKGDEV